MPENITAPDQRGGEYRQCYFGKSIKRGKRKRGKCEKERKRQEKGK
jgi:hypothetical protein